MRKSETVQQHFQEDWDKRFDRRFRRVGGLVSVIGGSIVAWYRFFHTPDMFAGICGVVLVLFGLALLIGSAIFDR